MQIITDPDYMIRNIVPDYPGSVHDARVLRSSAVFAEYEGGNVRGKIWGDSGYPALN